jgi:hypothetical protein
MTWRKWLDVAGFPNIPETPMQFESSPRQIERPYKGPWRQYWREEWRLWVREMKLGHLFPEQK